MSAPTRDGRVVTVIGEIGLDTAPDLRAVPNAWLLGAGMSRKVRARNACGWAERCYT
jgi:hypothetical protein